MRPQERLELALSNLGLVPEDATDEIACLIDLYGQNSTLDSIHRQLMLERFGSTDIGDRLSGPLDRRQVIAVLVRMASLDAATSYSVREVADGLGMDGTDVKALVEQGSLWSYSDSSRVHIPGWQFELDSRDNPVRIISPHLRRVLGAVPAGTPPALLRGLMTLGDPTLPTRSPVPMSPREYLIHGGPPLPVIATLLRQLEGSESRILDFMWESS